MTGRQKTNGTTKNADLGGIARLGWSYVEVQKWGTATYHSIQAYRGTV